MKGFKNTFASEHPIVLVVYLFGGMLITMLTMHPVVLMASIIIAGIYCVLLFGRSILKSMIWVMIPVLFFTMIILPLFSHNGITPLFYINDMPVTMESMIFGLVMSGLLLAIFLWFQIANALIDSEKILYLFGRTFPAVGLLISMVFRMIPLMRERFCQIQDGQRGMGRSTAQLSLMGKGKMLLKELSILISWSLESSIETSISMESRGYGTGHRTSFDLFRFTKGSGIWCVLFLGLYGIAVWVIGRGCYKASYFPAITIKDLSHEAIVGIITFFAAGILPVLYGISKYITEKYTTAKLRKENAKRRD